MLDFKTTNTPQMDGPYTTVRRQNKDGSWEVVSKPLAATDEEKTASYRAALERELAQSEQVLAMTVSKERFHGPQLELLTPETHRYLIDEAQRGVDAVKAELARLDAPAEAGG
jgi:hypothetical protein